MATTINAYSVSLGLDASNYIDSSKLSRGETNLLKRDIAAARDPMEKLQIETDRLGKAYQEGAISIEVYNRLLEAKRHKLLGVNDAVERQTSLMTRLSEVGNVISGLRNAWDMVSRAVSVAERAFSSFNNEAQRLDDIKDKAEKLGLSYRELGALQFAASRLGGDDAAGTIDKAIGQMLKRGMVEQGENAVDAFKRVANEINGIASQSERAARASEIFGKSGVDLLAVLQAGGDEIGNLADQWDRTNGLTTQQLEAIDQYNDLMEDISLQVQGLAGVFVAEFAPAITVLLEQFGVMDGSISSIRSVARDVVDTIVLWTAGAQDAAEAAVGMAKSIATGGLGYDAADFEDDKQAKAMIALWKKREEQASAAEKADKARQDARAGAMKDDFSDLIDGNAEAWDQFIADKEIANKALMQSLERAQRDLDRQYQDSVRAREKTIADVGKGPKAFDPNSTEGANYLAEQVNKAMADALIEQPTPPTDEEILKAAQENMKLQAEQNAKTEELRKRLETLIEVAKENGFKRIR